MMDGTTYGPKCRSTEPRCGLVALVPVLLLASLPAGFALAPTVGDVNGQRLPSRTVSLLPPARSSAADSADAPAEAQAAASSSSVSSTAGMLAAAREFASAYMSYQAGRKPGWVRTAIQWTCTPAFASNLLRQPSATASIATDGVTGVLALSHDTVRVNYSGRKHSDRGALVLTLSASRGRWLVSHVGA